MYQKNMKINFKLNFTLDWMNSKRRILIQLYILRQELNIPLKYSMKDDICKLINELERLNELKKYFIFSIAPDSTSY